MTTGLFIFMIVGFITWLTFMSMGFLAFIKKLFGTDSYSYTDVDLNNPETLPESLRTKFLELTRFGIGQGSMLHTIALFKACEDNNGILTGTFGNFMEEINRNVEFLMADGKNMELWNKKYSDFIKQSKEENK